MAYQWAEGDFNLPGGVERLGGCAPVSGQKFVMYHGTTRSAAESILENGFRQSADGTLGPGVYLSKDLNKASRFPLKRPESDRVVIKVVADVGKVTAINSQGHPLQKIWHCYGYDTAWVPPNCGMAWIGLEEHCVWDPDRIQVLETIYPKPSSQAPHGG